MALTMFVVGLMCSLALFNGAVTGSEESSKLIAVVQVFRHGERSPITFYTNDPYANESYWEDLEGQLTNRGKQQHLALGQFTRKRYSDFLPQRYNRHDLYAVTTDIERTHMSAQCNIYGIYPATGNQIWKTNLDWQPIPLHYIDPNLFDGSPYGCPNYEVYLAQLWKSPKYLAILEKYKEQLEYISAETGDDVANALDALTVLDCLEIEEGVGLQLPEWSKKVYPEPLKTLGAIAFKSLTDTDDLKLFYSGVFLQSVIDYFHNMAANNSYSHKYHIYSAHDSNIAAILNSFGQYDPPYTPAFASSVWIELREEQQKHYVNIFNKDGDNFKQLSIGKCDLNCPLDEFKKYLQDISTDIDGWYQKCSDQVNIKLNDNDIKIIQSFRNIKKLFS